MAKITGYIAKALRIVVPLGVSALLIVWLLHKVNLHQVADIMRLGVDYRYLIIMMLLTTLSHIIRGVRWGIQLRAAGIPRISWLAESVSIFGAYALNLVFPFLGEGWRCVYISRRENCKLSTVVGTDIGDRGSDAVMIVLITIITFIVARGPLDKFLDRYRFGEELTHAVSDGMIWIVAAIVIIVLAGALYLARHTKFVQGIKASAMRMWVGFRVMFHMKGRLLYIVLTLAIWVCYFFQTYACFFAFPFTRELISEPGTAMGFLPGLVVFVFGSFSMGVPSNGGLGPWNIAVAFALTLYGISSTDAAAYSIVCWSFQTISLILLGIFSAFYIMIERRKK